MSETDLFSDSKFNHLRCKLDKDDVHLYKHPMELPCGIVACEDCIIKLRQKKNVNCLCGSLHASLPMSSLVFRHDIVAEINENANEITEEIIAKLLPLSDELQDPPELREEMLNKMCEDVKSQINSRCDKIKSNLDLLRLELEQDLKKVEKDLLVEFNKFSIKVEENSKKCDEFSTIASNKKDDKEILKKILYECHDRYEELKELNENVLKVTSKFAFEPSNWLPNASHIGTFEHKDSRLNNCYDYLIEDDSL